MKRFAALCLLISFLVVPMVLSRPGNHAADYGAEAEHRRIEALLRHVEGLRSAAFIRNGVAYDAASAAKFLRAKWEAHGARTAAEFIDREATASSTTGRPYLIRLEGGREVRAGEYLKEALRGFEGAPRR